MRITAQDGWFAVLSALALAGTVSFLTSPAETATVTVLPRPELVLQQQIETNRLLSQILMTTADKKACP